MSARRAVPLTGRALALVLLLARVSAHEAAAAAPAPRKDREEAARLLERFDSLGEQYRRHNALTWRGAQAASLTGRVAPPHAALAAALQPALHPPLQATVEPAFLLQQDDGPPDVLLAAVRAARKAIAADPRDARAHLLLGRAYAGLARHTGERAWRRQLPVLERLRQAQVAAALSRAVALQPDLPEAHAGLASLYRDLGYADLTARHLRRVWQLGRAAGPAGGETREQFDRRIGQMKADLGALDKQLADRLDRYEVGTAGRPAGEKARAALQLGLAGKALEVLLASDVAAFGAAGARLELHLLLTTGRVKELGEWLTADVGEAIGAGSYHLLRLMHGAAVGDYREADNHLGKLIAERGVPLRPGLNTDLRARVATDVAQLVLDGAHGKESPAKALWIAVDQRQFQQVLGLALARLRERADLLVLRGLLAMESGDERQAARHFREALGLWRDEATAASGAGLDFPGRALAQRYLRAVGR